MQRKLQLLVFILFFISIKNAKAVCDFSIDKTTVCAGDVVTIQLAQPYAKYHNIIVYKGVFLLVQLPFHRTITVYYCHMILLKTML
jgi:hypothetical protein